MLLVGGMRVVVERAKVEGARACSLRASLLHASLLPRPLLLPVPALRLLLPTYITRLPALCPTLQDCGPSGAADDALHRTGGERGGTQVGRAQGQAWLFDTTVCCEACGGPGLSRHCTPQPTQAPATCPSHPPPSVPPTACRSLCLVSFDSHPEYGTLLAVGTAQGLKFYPKECQGAPVALFIEGDCS